MFLFNICSLNVYGDTYAHWIINTGASDYIVHTPYMYTRITLNIIFKVVLPNGENVDVFHVGVIKLNDGLMFNNLLCVSSFNFNLISTRRLTQDA